MWDNACVDERNAAAVVGAPPSAADPVADCLIIALTETPPSFRDAFLLRVRPVAL